ncbi:MAG: hypothetical protein V2B18_14655 [Pseudomonadota bacterium]
MQLVDPEKLRLHPGQCVQGIFIEGPESRREVGFFMRSEFGTLRSNGGPAIEQRAGLVRFNDVVLVVTLVKVRSEPGEVFDIWWNFHSQTVQAHARLMAEQERLVCHFYAERGKVFSVETVNGFKRFFGSLQALGAKTRPWSEVEFDRAVRGFCAQTYPKDKLWEVIGQGEDAKKPDQAADIGMEDYPGEIPRELHPYYVYSDSQGHCIKVVPSLFEDEAKQGNVDEYLMPAPVKTVMRCGVRWIGGYPVAPIPFIPGHGLAVPPEDTEL